MVIVNEIFSLILPTLISAAPLILAALAGLFCERSGVVNIALEGKMLAAAFAGFYTSAVLNQSIDPTLAALAGLGMGIVVGLLMSLIHGFSTVSLRGDQVVSGVAINLLAAGITAFLSRSLDQTAKGVKTLQTELGRLLKKETLTDDQSARVAELREALGPDRANFADINQQVSLAKRGLAKAQRALDKIWADGNAGQATDQAGLADQANQANQANLAEVAALQAQIAENEAILQALDSAFRAGRPEFVAARFTDIQPFADVPALSWISGSNLPILLALLAVPIVWWVIWHSRFGLRVRAVGEAPEAADTAGVSVIGTRYAAILISGALCGVAGSLLLLAGSGQFVDNMTAGRGYIALAALIFARWRPVATLGACLLFGLFRALSDRAVNWFDFGNEGWLYFIDQGLPQFFGMLPYVFTVVALALFAGRAIAPRAIGVAYVKER